MAVIVQSRYSEAIHPVHAVLLAGTFAFSLAAVLGDVAYARTFHIQWSNFASWLIVGALLFGILALVFAMSDLLRAHRRAAGIGAYFVLLLATVIVAVFNALMHARDAWAMMPGGLILSAVTTVLAALAAWLGFRTPPFMGGSR